MKNGYTSVCPVPTEQQPINEYQALSESCFFRTCAGALKPYLKTLAWFWLLSWIAIGPVAASSFPPSKRPIEFFLCGTVGTTLVVVLVVLRLYLGWNYIRDRLSNATVFYEESGWYDGQSWEKTPEILARDRLIVTHQVQPILARLQRSFIGLGITLAIAALVWIVLPSFV
jgi:Conserved in the green lineage and diatoms 27